MQLPPEIRNITTANGPGKRRGTFYKNYKQNSFTKENVQTELMKQEQ